jgi:hypothetical protein
VPAGRQRLCAERPAQSVQWSCWIGRRRIISGSAEHRGNSCQRKHPAENPGTRADLRSPVVTRIVSVARIRLASRKSLRPYKVIICADVSEIAVDTVITVNGSF